MGFWGFGVLGLLVMFIALGTLLYGSLLYFAGLLIIHL